MGFKDFLNESLQDVSGTSIDKELSEFVLSSLLFVAQTHVYHLVTKSYAEHVAIGEFYTCLQGATDGLAEQAIGLGIEQTDSDIYANIGYGYSKEILINQLNIYRGDLTRVIEATNTGSLMGINDTLVGIQTAIDSLLYKLQLG